MITPDYARHLARYNRWANGLLYDAAATLGEAAYREDRGAFFGSVHNTLNHLVVADRIWLARFEGAPNPDVALTDVPYDDFSALRAARAAEDARILDVIDGFDAAALARPLAFRSLAGVQMTMPLALAIGHFFNHQTHHRGQCHCMLTQAGHRPPQWDLLYFPDQEA
ncbi:MAG: DinB family protein [Alphaproteobacteria bacterium]